MTANVNQASLYSGNPGLNEIDFVVRQILAEANTADMVQIVAVHPNTGGGLIAGTVDVRPMVNAVDGAGNATPHAKVYGLIYFRLQAGSSAVIMDPVVNDIGIAVYCSRDISAVRTNATTANPGSFRRFSKSDGIYFGGWGISAPTQYIQFAPTGVNVVTPMTLNITAANITTSGAWAHTGTITANGHIIDQRHEHTGVQSGSSTTGPVV